VGGNPEYVNNRDGACGKFAFGVAFTDEELG